MKNVTSTPSIKLKYVVIVMVCVQGDNLLLRLASSVVYSLVCATSTCLPLAEAHQPVLSSLAKTLLAQDPPADLFWAEEGNNICGFVVVVIVIANVVMDRNAAVFFYSLYLCYCFLKFLMSSVPPPPLPQMEVLAFYCLMPLRCFLMRLSHCCLLPLPSLVPTLTAASRWVQPVIPVLYSLPL